MRHDEISELSLGVDAEIELAEAWGLFRRPETPAERAAREFRERQAARRMSPAEEKARIARANQPAVAPAGGGSGRHDEYAWHQHLNGENQ